MPINQSQASQASRENSQASSPAEGRFPSTIHEEMRSSTRLETAYHKAWAVIAVKTLELPSVYERGITAAMPNQSEADFEAANRALMALAHKFPVTTFEFLKNLDAEEALKAYTAGLGTQTEEASEVTGTEYWKDGWKKNHYNDNKKSMMALLMIHAENALCFLELFDQDLENID